ncbi:DUF6166 domain-containing protein [Haloarchaeobius sp. FL176]|uniref:DUF6166 domain-containing protein n=1 Tax=Haloarchaeobius sp. FL176 TaxID=2967129 RepID=UPI002147B202|nr:DUF6166 domain-containing protein [Haloarchaeobius sp. FL176]
MSGTTNAPSLEQTPSEREHTVVYLGYRKRGKSIVKKQPDGERLTPARSLELVSHSPTGFEWGYGGSGPAQLAHALLLDYTDDAEIAMAHYIEFKNRVVSQLDCSAPGGRWRLSASDIDAALHELADDVVASSL